MPGSPAKIFTGHVPDVETAMCGAPPAFDQELLRAMELQIKLFASHIPNQAALDKILSAADPRDRRAIFDQIKPHLRFTPAYNPLVGIVPETLITP